MGRKVRVPRKQVDAANAEDKAFRAAGLMPDPLVIRIADARVGHSSAVNHVDSAASGSGLSAG